MQQVNDKIAQYGLKSINNFETLTLFIPQLKAAALCEHFDGRFKRLMRATTKELRDLGLTLLEAHRITAINEVFNRMITEDCHMKKLSGSKDCFDVLKDLVNLNIEQFKMLAMNREGKLIKIVDISVGGVSGTVVDPKVVFKNAVDLMASTIILAHNHPSGNLKPSQADLQLTKKIQEAGKLLDIYVADHIIIGGSNFESYYSFADEGLM